MSNENPNTPISPSCETRAPPRADPIGATFERESGSPQQHRLTIHGMVDRPLSFSMDDLMRLPSVSRIHFVECQANGNPQGHDNGNENMGLPVQFQRNRGKS